MTEQAPSLSPPRRVVLDTNTVLDLTLFGDARTRPLGDALRAGRVHWIRTPAMRDELAHVAARTQMGRWSPASQEATIVAFAERWSQTLPEPPPGPANLPQCRDKSDQMFVALAWHAGADWLISRDRALLSLRRKLAPRGVRVATPEGWAAAQTKD